MAEKYLSTRCSNDHSHTRLEGGEQVQKAHTRKLGECRWADEVEAMRKARAFVPRTSRTRPSGLQGPRRHPTTQKEHHTGATSSKEHAAGNLATPGEPDIAQEEQII
eukprot:1918143-Amphidinium_carterae.2